MVAFYSCMRGFYGLFQTVGGFPEKLTACLGRDNACFHQGKRLLCSGVNKTIESGKEQDEHK